MRTLTIYCGCGRKVQTMQFDDDKPSSTIMGECAECYANGGQYNKSSAWNHKEDERIKRKVLEQRAVKEAYKDVKPLKEKRKKR